MTADTTKKQNSAFTWYFFLILILVAVLLSLFSLYIAFLASRNYRERQALTEQGMLMQATERVDNTLYLVNRLAAGTAENQDIVTSSIVPSLDNPQRTFSIVSVLNSLVQENMFIDDAYLYEHTKGYVFSSDSLISSLSGMRNSATLSHCLYSPSYLPLQEEKNRFSSRLVQDGQAIYFVYDFIYTNEGPLSTLILKLNKESLFAGFLQTPSLDQYEIRVSGNRVTPVYVSKGYNPGVLDRQQPSITYVSGYTAWAYALFPHHPQGLLWLKGLPQLLPFLAAVLLISLIVTYFITRRAFKPIEYLTQLVAGHQENPREAGGRGREFLLLEDVYQKLMLDNAAASTLIETVRPQLEEKLLGDLLEEKEYGEEELSQQLTRLDSSMHVRDKYQVLLFDLSGSPDPLSLRICQMHVHSIVSQAFPEGPCTYYLMDEGVTRVRMVIRYPEETSMAQAKRTLRQFTEALDQELIRSSLSCLYESGSVSLTLPGLYGSFEAASKKLRQRLYYRDDPETEGSQIPVSPSGEAYYGSLLHQIGEKISAADLPLAQTCLTKLLQELFEDPSGFATQRVICDRLVDLMIERILPYQLEKTEQVSASYADIYVRLQETSDSGQLRSVIEVESARLMDTLRAESGISQKRMAAQAREYMTNHYDNCDLSINDIAQYVGCSSSYLSTVFSEATGENLITWLNHYRINMACDLLLNSRILIRDIGLKTGFNTIQNFNRVFKKQTGMTPNEYRKSLQKEAPRI